MNKDDAWKHFLNFVCVCKHLIWYSISDTDYSISEFPSGACILDYLRCSITFKTPKHLLDGVEYVIDKIESNKIKSLSKILRIKNGFKNILKWNSNSLSDYNYVDLKMNVIFNNKFNTESQIVEIQFLLDFLLKAKKLGHKYYGIKRKDVEIHSVNNIMENTNNNYNRYKSKILEIIKDNNVSQLTIHLFLRPNCILSMFNDYHRSPYLYSIGKTRSLKLFELFLDCLFHFGEVLLNEKKPFRCNNGCYEKFNNNDDILLKHKLFIQKYFNFTFGDEPSASTCFVKSFT